jgi:protoporphyrin/coproporphyrin ferrochelatase
MVERLTRLAPELAAKRGFRV